MKISIIIPLYKAELYIRECIDKLLSQTYRDIDVILVDDGSPDSSGKIADEYANQDTRVISIHKQNGGASDARNKGVTYAKGDYLLFVDADDFLKSQNSMSCLVNCLKDRNFPDVLGFNIEYYFPSTNKFIQWPSYSEHVTSINDKNILIEELVKTGSFPVSPCGKLIKREAYINSGICFKVGTIGEDIPWTIELFDKLSSIVFTNEYHYCYRQEVETSVTADFSEKKYYDMLNITTVLPDLVHSTKFKQTTKNALLSFVAYELSIMIAGIDKLSKNNRLSVQNQLKKMTYLFKYTANPKVKKVNTLYSFLGFKLTAWALSVYLRYGAKSKRA